MPLTVDESATPPGTAWLVLRVSSAGVATLSSVDDLGKLRARGGGHLRLPVAAFLGDPDMAARLLGVPRLPLTVPLDAAAERFGDMELDPAAVGWMLRAWRKSGLDGRCLIGMWISKVYGTEPRPLPKAPSARRTPPPDGYRFRSPRPDRCPGCATDFPAGEPVRMFARRPNHEACATRRFRELKMIRREFAGV